MLLPLTTRERVCCPAGIARVVRHVRAVVTLLILAAVLGACGSGIRPTLVAGDTLAPTPEPEPIIAELPPTAIVEVAPTALPTVPVANVDPLRCLSTRQRLGQTLMPLVVQAELDQVSPLALRGELAGVTLLGSPDANLAAALKAVQLGALIPLHIASDEEGGVVQRLASLIEPLPSAQEMASQSPADVQARFASYGARMKELGVTMAFAPVVDVGGGPGIESRSFSSDPTIVATYGRAVVDGYESAGIVPVLKHFPGHGRATGDSHLTLPSTPPLNELRDVDLVPFVELLPSAPAVMVAHLLVPGLSDETPTSLSPATINGLLRSELGYDGLVITDAFNMAAISANWTNAQASAQAISAGADMVILTSVGDVTPVLDELEAAMGAAILSSERVDEAALRVLTSKGQQGICG